MRTSSRWWIGLLAILIAEPWTASALVELTVESCPELAKLNDLQKAGTFVDVIFEAPDGTRFEGHKAVLAAKSDKLRDLILKAEEGKPCTCEKLLVKLPVDGKLMEDALEYTYSGKITVDNDTVSQLLTTANKLGLTELVDTLVEQFVGPTVTDETLVTIITTTTERPRSPEVEEKIVQQVLNVEKLDEQRATDLIKKLDPKLLKKFIDKTTLEPNELAAPITEWLKEAPNNPATTPEEVAEIIEKLPVEEMNCTSLKEIADELGDNQDPKLAEAAKVYLKRIMDLSTNGKGPCYSGCADCERAYQFAESFRYDPARGWNASQSLLPHQIQGFEYPLGRFSVGGIQFLATLQRADKLQVPNIGLNGLMLRYIPPIGGKTSKIERREYDVELQVVEKGKEKDCPLFNRFRYKFDPSTSVYKWFTKIDTTKENAIHIKINEVV